MPFYLQLDAESPKRIETDQLIEWLALSASDWHNIAFKVFQLVDDDEAEPTADPKSNSSE